MKSPRTSPLLLAVPLILLAGCSSHHYYAYAPQPVYAYNSAPPLLEQARHEGFRIGSDIGARDSYRGYGYQPKHDRAYHDTPGYDPALGPYGPYRDAFRQAYLSGYDRGYYRR
jgi:hypothetical protein